MRIKQFLCIALSVLLLLASGALVQLSSASNPMLSPAYDLSWWTVDGGGHTFSTGGTYTLGGTIGQPDAFVIAADTYTLQGGFWPGGEVLQYWHIYLPLLMRDA